MEESIVWRYVLCKRNDTHENKASVAIFLVCKHCFCHSNVPAKNVGLLRYFILQKSQLPFYPLSIQF